MPFTPHSASLTSLAYRHLANDFNNLHECGHTLVIWFMPGSELLMHITVIPDEDGSDRATVTEVIKRKRGASSGPKWLRS
ncbi:hypothetical protein niasHS_012553 [Heterodera schachtii]|uniref:Uncharacterized protein n=2 Tax=Heterodera TaxID=34509 RepID=A0ABD2IQY0_HETSC